MPETTHLLETALENEAKLLLKMISELENEDLFDFARRLSEVKTKETGHQADDILAVAQNIKSIEWALESLYTV